MSEQLITPELRQWIIQQAQAGHSADVVLEAMKASGWEESVALDALEQVMMAGAAQAQAATRHVPEVVTDGLSRVWAHDKFVNVLVQIRHPRVVVFGDFLSAQECEELKAQAQPRMTRSQTVVNATGDSEVNEVRTSQGMFFERGESELCRRIEARIAALVNWPVENGEGIQVLRYAPGAEYKPHFDYFDPNQPGTAPILKRGGQRVGTVVMYLNTPDSGGATTFPDAGVDVHAVAGQAVFFAYGLPHPSTKTLHGGAPVQQGEKWVATKWLRERPFE
ncbi:MAG TPA: 2OG-Fe(II) oxygenase [Aquabacterium sp.]|uniref:2OG-Fe(II) oxygenase n=1 Tax=Aquabacterium sp. TaxID=1872578 RepID=UPI002E2F654B|nr:2OG-Fe(II) oxygenase [Aquabacterium sp.]HEX5354789.1 2OG-Fe(II) oxygenase [Aquabacterium sp.]